MGIFSFIHRKNTEDDEYDYIASGAFLDEEEDEERECYCCKCGRTFIWSEGASRFNELISPNEGDFYDISGDDLCGDCAAERFQGMIEDGMDIAINEWGYEPEMFGL